MPALGFHSSQVWSKFLQDSIELHRFYLDLVFGWYWSCSKSFSKESLKLLKNFISEIRGSALVR